MGQVAARHKINRWFWAGASACFLGGLLVLSAMWGMANEDKGIYGSVAVFGGTLAMLVGAIGKGVELGVRAANDD